MSSLWRQTGVALRMIQVAHTLFALPFALAALLLATGGRPPLPTLCWVVVAMLSARSAAMAFNRLVDARFDAANPRTRDRALPRSEVSPRFVAVFVVLCSGVFVASAAMLNALCLALSPLALGVVLGYSLAKRFTAASHLWLGLALGLSPVCAWLAFTGRFDRSLWTAIPLALSVLFWVCGFDLIYACQDADFDRQVGLHSVPARCGVPAALRWSAACHVLSVASLLVVIAREGLGWMSSSALVAVSMLLCLEHVIARSQRPGSLQFAFFGLNSCVGLIVLAGVAGDLWW